MRRLLLLSMLTAIFSGCNKPSDFLYFHPDIKKYSMTHELTGVTHEDKLDIFWLIGGMTEQAGNFGAGTALFMSNFLPKHLSWRMAVAVDATSKWDGSPMPPLLGMPQIFDSTSLNPLSSFVNAVISAATNGPDAEVVFDPIVQQLTNYPNFTRPNVPLVIIMTNDAADESVNVTTAADMIRFLTALKGDIKQVIVYGVFGATDLGCDPSTIDGDWLFHGSEFEKLINATGGKTYSLCDTTFGDSLSKIGDNIFRKISHPKVFLDAIPDPASIQVLYQGKVLPGGPQESGGYWYYDATQNAVIFYSTEFTKGGSDQVTVNYSQYSPVQ